jgi:anaerobic selenocysteine-containing dehydrogenase
LGKTLPKEAAAAAPFLPLSVTYAQNHYAAVKRAGHDCNRLSLGASLFHAILEKRAGTVISKHEFKDMWSFIRHEDGRVHLDVPEMLEELRALRNESPPGKEFPFILLAGERRSYNANTIFRNPAWRRIDSQGAMRIHPEDAAALGLGDGGKAVCASATGEIEVIVEINDSVRRGVVTLPHGYGMRYNDGAPIGPAINRLTTGGHCDPFTRTPYHKYVPVRLRAA